MTNDTSPTSHRPFNIYEAIMLGKSIDDVCGDDQPCRDAYARSRQELARIKQAGGVPNFVHELPSWDDEDDDA